VALDAEEAALLAAVQGCLRAYPVPEPAALAAASVQELIIRLQEARLCEHVPGAPMDAASALVDALETRYPSTPGDRPRE
jgi:hypothetical protein